MADRVRFILDRLAPFFNQVADLSLLNDEETKAVIKRITDYEYLMMRREMHESDVTPYVQYAINFDKLLVSRIQTFKSNSSNYKERDTVKGKDWIAGTRRVSSILVSHIAYVYDRIIRRFPNSIQLWDSYINFLSVKDSRSNLNAAYGRALSLHPEVERLWIQAAAHELSKNQNIHSARVLLQRGLRANKSSKVLWLKYFDIEVFNASKVTTRKRSLSISADNMALLGVPLVVLRHAVINVPNDVPFAFEFVKRASSVSQLLSEKVIELLDGHFAGSLEFWKNRISNFLNFSTVKSDLDDSSELQNSSSSHLTTCSNHLDLSVRDSPFLYSSTFDIVEESLGIANEALGLVEAMRSSPSSSSSSSSSSSGWGSAVARNSNKDSISIVEIDSLEMIITRLIDKLNLVNDSTQGVPSKRTKRAVGLNGGAADKLIDQSKDFDNCQKNIKERCSHLISTSNATYDAKDRSSAVEQFKLQVTSLTIHLRLDMLSQVFKLKIGNSHPREMPSEKHRLSTLKDLVTKVNSFIREQSSKSLLTEGLAIGIYDRVCHYLILSVEYYLRFHMLMIADGPSASVDLLEQMESILKVVTVSPLISQSKYIVQLYSQLVSLHSYLSSQALSQSQSSSMTQVETSLDGIVMDALPNAKADPKLKIALLTIFIRRAGSIQSAQFMRSFRQIESLFNANPHILPALSLGSFYESALDIAESMISTDQSSSAEKAAASSISHSTSTSRNAAIKEIAETALKRCSSASPISGRFSSALEGILRSNGNLKEANLLKLNERKKA